MGRTIVLAAALLAVGIVVALLVDRSVHAPAAPAAMAAQPIPEPTTSSNSRSVTLSRRSDGHFWTDARVDGRRLEFIVDTGAGQIVLRASDAAMLGIHPTPRDYSLKIGTANGVTRAAPVQLRMVEIGNVVVRDVPAHVLADKSLGVNLLGMTFLSRVRFTHDRGKLVLEQ
jgi:aspartyl protease family protein